MRILLDPILSERTSPVLFAGPKRYSPTACTLDELPDVDLVVTSHDHYDHMDSDTLLKLYKKRKRSVHFLVALENAPRIHGFGIGKDAVPEIDWREQALVDAAAVRSVTMTCTPSQHFSGRGILDHGSTLWCSWVMETIHPAPIPVSDGPNEKKLFFAAWLVTQDTDMYPSMRTRTRCLAVLLFER